MWLVMRGALSANVKRVHRSYYLPSMTGIATRDLRERGGRAADAEAVNDGTARRMAEQLAGIEELTGTYPFDLARSVKALPHQQVPARPGRRPSTARRFLADAGDGRSRRPASPRRSRTSSAAATGRA